MTARNGALSVAFDATTFATRSNVPFGSLASSIDPVAFFPLSQSRIGAWSRTFNSGFLPDLETPMVIVQVLQSTATTLSVFMRDGSTGLGLTGIAPSAFTIKLKKSNQSSFSVITPTVTETGLGWYDLAMTTGNTDTTGKAPMEIAATGAATRDDIILDVLTLNMFTDAVRAGLTALPNANAGVNTGLPVVGTQIPNANAGANTGLPVVGSQIPNANAGAVNGLPVQGGAIPNATAGANTGLPIVGTQIPNATAGANNGLPVQGGAIPNATAGANNGLPIQGGAIPNANAAAVGGLAIITAVGQGPGGQIKANSFNDKYVYDVQGRMTSCRMRVFANKATADTASDSDPDGTHGEVERFRVTVTYNTDSTIKTYEYAKEL